MKLMLVENKLFLHILNIEKGLQIDELIKGKTEYYLLNVFFNCWVSVYTVIPEIIRLDRETSFMANEVRQKC